MFFSPRIRESLIFTYLWAAPSAIGPWLLFIALRLVILCSFREQILLFGCPNVSFGKPCASTLASWGTLGQSLDVWKPREGYFRVQASILSILGGFRVPFLKPLAFGKRFFVYFVLSRLLLFSSSLLVFFSSIP